MVGLMQLVNPCWKPAVEVRDGGSVGRADRYLWYKNLAAMPSGSSLHGGGAGECSVGGWKADRVGPLELEGGHARHVRRGLRRARRAGDVAVHNRLTERLFAYLKRFASEHEGISVDVIRKAFSATEVSFISIVRKQWLNKPQIASVGLCCLVGIISDGMLYVANVGDSYAVLEELREVTAVQMSAEDNASVECVRRNYIHCIQ